MIEKESFDKLGFIPRILLLLTIFSLSGYSAWVYYQAYLSTGSLLVQLSAFFTALFLIGPLAYFALLGVLRYCFYREFAPPSDEELPVCTVIVPAYNEGSHVSKTLESLLKSDYPAEKFEIIAVNDGSIDDTLMWIQKSAAQAPDRIKIINFPQNRSKRHALNAGFAAGKGEIFVTIDSDSIVEPQAMRRIVAPFVNNPHIGAVSGSVRVSNTSSGLLPALFESSFTFAFDFIRCGQSVFHDVLCTPGAIAAYRADVVHEVREKWVCQTFMGRPSNIGEDRALTTMILEQGYGVVTQRSARISTNVPETYLGITRMLLRWERSNIRENFRMYQFIFKDFRWNDSRRWFLLLTLLVYTQAMLLPLVMMFISFYYIILTKGGILIGIILTTLLWSTLPALVNLQHRSIKLVCYCYIYGLLYLLTFFWLVPYALLTMNNSNWLTRTQANSAGKI